MTIAFVGVGCRAAASRSEPTVIGPAASQPTGGLCLISNASLHLLPKHRPQPAFSRTPQRWMQRRRKTSDRRSACSSGCGRGQLLSATPGAPRERFFGKCTRVLEIWIFLRRCTCQDMPHRLHNIFAFCCSGHRTHLRLRSPRAPHQVETPVLLSPFACGIYANFLL